MFQASDDFFECLKPKHQPCETRDWAVLAFMLQGFEHEKQVCYKALCLLTTMHGTLQPRTFLVY
jgi:hypothetical protein